MNLEARVCLVGGGKMGGALLAGWRARGWAADRIEVVEPDAEAATRLARRFSVAVVAVPEELEPGPPADVVVLAVKPQVMDGVARAYRERAGAGAVFLSIAAGCPIAALARPLGDAAAIVRAMPNTPAAIGRGISVACANSSVTPVQRALCESLLAAVGEVAWVEDEAWLDAATAVSGSGPAYLFLFVECLARAGEEAGLSAELALRLAETTVWGAAELAHQAAAPLADLRRDVTSPGGTTAAALDVLMAEDGLAGLLSRAVRAAIRRSRELGH